MTKVVWLMKRSAGAEIDPADLEELLDVMKIGNCLLYTSLGIGDRALWS